jgi:glycosyltransferase involved in cell wall biosynthesis
MKVLLAHNYYQRPGGEDAVMKAECELLKAAGHHVSTYLRHNDEIERLGFGGKAFVPLQTLWAQGSARQLGEILRREKPDVAHFHNTFPLISPSAYYACREAGVPVVQTLHNYRLLCPTATFFRNGQVCEECVQHSLWRAVGYGCYRRSRLATATVALMLAAHQSQQTWTEMIDCYVTPTEFARKKFIEAGFPADLIVSKPNFVQPDPGVRESRGEYALFVGRLEPEKGLSTLVLAWKELGKTIPLRIVGEGSLRATLETEAAQNGLTNITFAGQLNYAETIAAMKRARFLVFPSECYETFGRTIAEAFACGVPVLASRLGAMEEIVEHNRTGLHFSPAAPHDLAKTVRWAWAHPNRMAEMGRTARAEYEAKYTAKRNYRLLMDIYERAIQIRKAA